MKIFMNGEKPQPVAHDHTHYFKKTRLAYGVQDIWRCGCGESRNQNGLR